MRAVRGVGRRSVGRGVERERLGRAGLLVEVEVVGEVAEGLMFSRTSGRESGRPSVRGSRRCPCEEVVLDELEVGVEAEDLVVDVALPGVGADHERRARGARSRRRRRRAA